ncbi:hypothetical protein ACWGSK_24045 [Nocardiopsis sp. NPDC055551]|uniref:hypothetical protein n=1 Tax=Nocardiopsis sp. NPDC006832 TaxID=3157188 RepID=UPI0033C471F0
MPVTVIEHWHLNEESSRNAFSVMQEMDDLVEDNAHAAPGWDGHARFFQLEDDTSHVLMIYNWGSKEEAEAMLESEKDLLADFIRTRCTRDREIEFAEELPVDV